MNPRIKDILTFLIGWPLSIVALYFVIKTFLPKFSDIKDLITNLNPLFLIIGIFCFSMYYFLRSIVWQMILGEYKYSIFYKKTSYLWASAELKRYVPGNIWSFLSKSVSFTNEGVTKSHLAKSMLFELQFILIGAVVVSLLGIPFLKKYLLPDLLNIPYLQIVIAVLVVLFIIVFIYQNYISKLLPVKFKGLIAYILPNYAPFNTFRLLLISVLAFLFFGLGYFFSISSIIYLDVKLILTLSGFFVFSLLVGLLSFITPTGLGVREGMVTLGLSKLLPMSVAGFASVFARLILIISEIMFLILTFIYSKVSLKLSGQLEKFVRTKKHKLILLFCIIIFNLYFIPVSFLRHDNFYTGRFDLGNMDQTVWNTKHGRIFEFTNPDGIDNTSRLAFHADFILILLSPFYLIWENPKMLLLIQSLVVSLGAIFVYLLADKVLSENGKWKMSAKGGSTYGGENRNLLSLALSISYLMNPSLQWSILYDFHAVTFATTFLIAAFYFIYTKRYFWFIVFSLFSGITKEQVWIPVGMMGLYLVVSSIPPLPGLWRGRKYQISSIKIQTKKIIFGLIIFCLSLITFYYLVWHAIPNASTTNSHFAVSYFEGNSDNTSGLIGTFLSDPYKIISKLFDESRVNYLRSTFEPLGYLPLLAPLYLLFPIADFSLNILSDKPELHQIYYQYSAIITPFIFIGSIFAISYLVNLYKKNVLIIFFAFYVMFFALYGGYINGPLPWTKKPNVAMLHNSQANKKLISEKLMSIPTDFKVSSTNNLGAHLTHRQHIYTIPYGSESADMIVFLLRPNSPEYERDLVYELLSNPIYDIVWNQDGFIGFKKKSTTGTMGTTSY